MRYTSIQDMIIEFKFKLKRNLTEEEVRFVTWIYKKQFELTYPSRRAIHNR